MRIWLRPDPVRKTAEQLYAAVVTQARRPEFYARLGVPDSLDGRFELIALHMFIALRRLKVQGQAAAAGQALVDLFVQDMDASLRELGAGDLGVGRRVKAMVQALYGRIAAYEAGLAGPGEELEAALRRNLFGTAPEPGPQAAVLRLLSAYVRQESLGAVLAPDGLRFGPPPDLAAAASAEEPGR
jgi:cytochrome b pre-mRNA-processing protein 3